MKVTRDVSMAASMVATAFTPMSPSSLSSYSMARVAFILSAMSMNRWLMSMPTTSPKSRASSNVERPTAQPRSSARVVGMPDLAAQVRTRSPHLRGKSRPSDRMPCSARKSANAISRGPKCRDRYWLSKLSVS
jgi:hypothetical protein